MPQQQQNFLIRPTHPFEEDVGNEVMRLIEKTRWPLERAGIKVSFSIRADDVSRTDVEAIKRGDDGRVHGWVRLNFNHLFLIQRPGIFLQEVVHHEFVHALVKAQCVASCEKPHNQHDERFIGEHAKLTRNQVRGHQELLRLFDPRPIRLARRGLPARCDCENLDGFWALSGSDSEKLRQKKISCPKCDQPLARVGDDAVPALIQEQCGYIRWWDGNARER